MCQENVRPNAIPSHIVAILTYIVRISVLYVPKCVLTGITLLFSRHFSVKTLHTNFPEEVN